MRIAVTSDKNDLTGIVPEKFESSKFLFIIDMDKMTAIDIVPSNDKDSDYNEFALRIVQQDCEAVICGSIDKVAFELIAGYGVTRYNGAGYSVKEALSLMNKDKLAYITDFVGGTGCNEEHSSCDCDYH